MTLSSPGSSKQTYIEAIVDIARPLNKGKPDPDHGMITVQRVKPKLRRRLRELGGRRIYPITSVYHSVHIVPIDETSTDEDSKIYINNTAD